MKTSSHEVNTTYVLTPLRPGCCEMITIESAMDKRTMPRLAAFDSGAFDSPSCAKRNASRVGFKMSSPFLSNGGM
jgi:hypothetical protein